MTNKYAVVSDGIVINTVLWNGIDEWQPESGMAVPAGDEVGIGWLYNDDSFAPPPPPPLSHAEQVALAAQKKEELIALAIATTSLWRTELLLGLISDEDKAALTDWILFQREVQDIDIEKAPDIEWPEPPQAR